MSNISGYKNAKLICDRGCVIENGFVRIFQGKILDVGPMEANTNAEGLLDARGLTIVPGLIDCHTHLAFPTGVDNFQRLKCLGAERVTLLAQANAVRTLCGGVVRVREMGAPFQIDITLRESLRSGVLIGPEIHASGRHIGPTGGQGWMFGVEADGPLEMVKAVREEIKLGADQIKLMVSGGVVTDGTEPNQRYVSEEEIRAVVESAHTRGRKVACHAHSRAAVEAAVRSGTDTIEHGSLASEEALEAMAKAGQILVPTLSAPKKILDSPESYKLPSEMIAKTERLFAQLIRTVKLAKQLGVTIACGSDAGSPLNHHGDNLSELRLLIEHGFTPLEAVAAATETAAMILGMESSTGTITSGKRADLTVFRGDVLSDPLRVLYPSNVECVWIDGRRISTALGKELVAEL